MYFKKLPLLKSHTKSNKFGNNCNKKKVSDDNISYTRRENLILKSSRDSMYVYSISVNTSYSITVDKCPGETIIGLKYDEWLLKRKQHKLNFNKLY